MYINYLRPYSLEKYNDDIVYQFVQILSFNYCSSHLFFRVLSVYIHIICVKIIIVLRLGFCFNLLAFSVLPSAVAQSCRHGVEVLPQPCISDCLFPLTALRACAYAQLCRVYPAKCLVATIV